MVENTPGRPPLRFHNVCTPCIGARNYQRCGGQRQLQCMFLNAIINFRSQSRRRPNWLPIKISARCREWVRERRSQNSTESERGGCVCVCVCALATFWSSSAHTLTHSLAAYLPGIHIHTHSLMRAAQHEWVGQQWMENLNEVQGPVSAEQGIFPALVVCNNYCLPRCLARREQFLNLLKINEKRLVVINSDV